MARTKTEVILEMATKKAREARLVTVRKSAENKFRLIDPAGSPFAVLTFDQLHSLKCRGVLNSTTEQNVYTASPE